MEIAAKSSNYPLEAPQLSREFLEVLKKWLALFCQHYRQELTEVGVLSYEIALRDLTYEQLERGCDLAMQECDFMPRASEIRKRSGLLNERLEEMFLEAKASDIFSRACTWAYSNSSPEIPPKEELPPTVAYAMRMAGGIKALLDNSQHYWVRKSFIEAYMDITRVLKRENIADRKQAAQFILKMSE